MKVRQGRLLLLGAAGAVAFWLWNMLLPSPEHVIRTRLAQVAEAASISPDEGQLTRLAKIQKLISFFSSDVEITVDIPGRSMQTFTGKDEIQQAALGARWMQSSLKIKFVDILVSMEPDKKSALARLTATASLPGERLPEVQELAFHLKKSDHDWIINRVDTVKTLR
jgi:hypothetical protein